MRAFRRSCRRLATSVPSDVVMPGTVNLAAADFFGAMSRRYPATQPGKRRRLQAAQRRRDRVEDQLGAGLVDVHAVPAHAGVGGERLVGAPVRARRRTSSSPRSPRRRPRSTSLTWATRASSARSGSGGTAGALDRDRPHARHLEERDLGPGADERVDALLQAGRRSASHAGVPNVSTARRPSPGRTRPTPRARRGRPTASAPRHRVGPLRLPAGADLEVVAERRAGAAHAPAVVHAAAVERPVGDVERGLEAVGHVDGQRVRLRVADDGDPASAPPPGQPSPRLPPAASAASSRRGRRGDERDVVAADRRVERLAPRRSTRRRASTPHVAISSDAAAGRSRPSATTGRARRGGPASRRSGS